MHLCFLGILVLTIWEGTSHGSCYHPEQALYDVLFKACLSAMHWLLNNCFSWKNKNHYRCSFFISTAGLFMQKSIFCCSHNIK